MIMNRKIAALKAQLAACAIALGSSAGLLMSAEPVKNEDPEVRLAHAQQAVDAVEKVVSAGAPTPEQAASREDWVRARFPGTGAAAGIDMGRARGLFAQSRYAEAIQAADRFVADYPRYGGMHGAFATLLARLVGSRTVSNDVKAVAFPALLRHCRGSAWCLGLSQKHLAGLPVDDAEKYRLARQGEETCGPLPDARVFLWSFLEKYARTAAPDVIVPELERFQERYNMESPESVACRARLLAVRAKRGDAASGPELEQFLAGAKKEQAESEALYAACRELLKAGRVAEACDKAAAFRKMPKRLCQPSFWAALNTQAAAEPLETQARCLVLSFDCLPGCMTGDELYKTSLESPIGSRDDVVESIVRWVRDNANDRQRDTTRVSKVVNRIQDQNARIRSLRTAADLCRVLNAPEQESNYLFELGRFTHDIDRAESIAALQRSIDICPESFPAAKSAWLLALLKGDITVWQSPLPRAPGPMAADDSPPALSLPAAPVSAEAFVTVSNAIQLKPCNPALNGVLGQAPVASPGENAQAITDGDPKTFWKPSSLPASVLVPLKERGSVERIVVKTVEPCGAIVTLLDADGRALGKYERLWNFWEFYNVPGLWPAETIDLKVLPVDSVSFVRVDLYEPLGTFGGIREIETYASRFPMQAVKVDAPAPVPAGGAALAVRWSATEPEREVIYRDDTESARTFNVVRWRTPWRKFPGKVRLAAVDPLALDFYGTNATLVLGNPGRVNAFVDGASRTVRHLEKEPSDHPLTNGLARGWHRLVLNNVAYDAADGLGFAGGVEVGGLKVSGRSRVTPAIRFGDGKIKWGDWFRLDNPEGTPIPVPLRGWWGEATHYQTALVFDTREVRGTDTASIGGLTVVPAVAESAPAPGGALRNLTDDPPAMADDLETVAALVSGRRVVVVYPKMGTEREYEAARRLADRAGVYLVSDDACLAGYPGLFLSVGRPLVHRQARQLLASRQVWNSPDYLNDADGVVGLVAGGDGEPGSLYVTGETVDAVEKAAERLRLAVKAYPVPREPFRLFASDTLEMVYAWQLHPERAAPDSLSVRLGVNDRRSAQFGVAANARLDQLALACSPLRSESGDELPAALVRTVGFFEWMPFFGDLRLPNELLEKPNLPVPANTAFGVWVTFNSAKGAKPGVYTGELAVTSGGFRQTVPVRVTVEPVPLPDFARAKTYSFSYVPVKWFHDGTPAYEKALRELARNEAVHGVSVVSPRLGFDADYVRVSNGWSFVSKFDIREMKVFEEVNRELGKTAPTFLMPTPDLRMIDRDLFHEGGNRPLTVTTIFTEQLAAYLKSAGLADRLYVKVADEPGDIKQWAEMARPLKEGGLRTMTCHSGNYTNIEEAVGVMNPWCPNYQHDVTRPFFKERQKAGDDVWWYCCGTPVTRVTGTPIENLPFYWLTAKWRFDGAMNYAAMHVSEYYMPVPFRYDHGLEYRFMFLPDGSTLDTTRRELEQEGISDMKLIEFVRDRAQAMRAAGKGPEADRAEAELEAIIGTIVPYKYGYSQVPADWHAARAKVYDLAVRTAAIR